MDALAPVVQSESASALDNQSDQLRPFQTLQLIQDSDQAATVQPSSAPVKTLDDPTDQVLELRRQGASHRTIAIALGIPKTRVFDIIHRQLNRLSKELNTSTVTITRENIQRKIFELAPSALQKVADLSKGARKEEVQLKASTDILDRAGFNPVQRTLNVHIYEEMTREQLLERLRQYATNAGALHSLPVQSLSNLDPVQTNADPLQTAPAPTLPSTSSAPSTPQSTSSQSGLVGT